MSLSPPAEILDKARLYRAIFRLHFYAGLIVAPFLLVLSLTGAVYLFEQEIQDLTFGPARFAGSGEHLSPGRLVQSAQDAYPGSAVTRIDLPIQAQRTAMVFMTSPSDAPFRVYVDPVSAQVSEAFVYERTVVGFADLMHGSLLMGERGDLLVELVACWVLVLIGTGVFLWWPRGGGRIFGVFLPRRRQGRAMWREVHAVTGIWVSGLLLFLVMTGLPWAANWGSHLQGFMQATGSGYPESYRHHGAAQASDAGHERTLQQTVPGIAWTLETAPAPRSIHAEHAEHAEHAHAGGAMAAGDATPLDVGQVAAILAERGLTTGYRLSLPVDAHDVFTAYTYPDRPQGQRTLHLDQYTGEVLNDVGFADYGIGAQAVELGVQIHMGNYFGRFNQLLMLIAALGGAVLAISGPMMWLKRRRTGLGAPAAMPRSRAVWMMMAGLVLAGLIFPMLGITALAVFALEWLVLRRIEPVRQWLGLGAA